MLVGKYPFACIDGQKSSTLRKIANAEYALPPDLQLTDGCKDLIKQIFTIDPTHRISTEDIKQHAWFTAKMPEALEVLILMRLKTSRWPTACVSVVQRLLYLSSAFRGMDRAVPRAVATQLLTESASPRKPCTEVFQLCTGGIFTFSRPPIPGLTASG